MLPAVQNAMTDVRRVMGSVFGFGFDKAPPGFSKTSFEGFDLNDLVDMVDNANPGDLEAVGDALFTASGKIEELGVDLFKHIEGVDWEGEAGTAFREWGKDLANNTKKLGTYTGSASTQIKAAGMGLAMVRNSMPPKDDGTGPTVKDIKSPAQVETNPEFVKAQKADAKREQNRQEAIIQMTKLSSYYQVSHETLAAESPPVFKPMPPAVGVPKPPPIAGDPIVGGYGSSQPSVGQSGITATGAEGFSGVSDASGQPGAPVPAGQPGTVPSQPVGAMPDQQVGTEIDSVQSPPAPNTTEPTSRPVTQPGPGPGPANPTPVGPVSNMPPARPVGPKGPSITGNPRSTGPTKTGPTGPVGRPTGPPGPVGRPTTTGPTTGPVGRPTTTGPTGPVGRPVSPQPTGRSGIYGGQPNPRTTTGESRVPRGLVVGNDQPGRTPMGRGPMGMGMGNMGPTGGGAGNSSARRLASTPGGIVGTPRAAAGGQTGRAFTPGGTGLVRGGGAGSNAIGMAPRGQTPNGRDRERNDSQRPDYLVEDEETWTTGRRDSAPPVVE
ncbi:hypothetical protein DVA86_24905 [Streptomyces armeniacus]|uniref:PPE domain-containing protein n=1 Tax=Streptomyces armeniacus TaxID=83291 RepID=A0A345XUT9_9ACTN|nr:hypothetical protein DVA86_24905 [Streptomyces armeniacus]